VSGFSHLLDPPPLEGVKFAIFFGREFFPPYLVQGQLALEGLTVVNEPLAGGVGHDRAEDRHFGANGRIAHAGRKFLAGGFRFRTIPALSLYPLLLLALNPVPPSLLPPKG
jgi:hypothetical protein